MTRALINNRFVDSFLGQWRIIEFTRHYCQKRWVNTKSWGKKRGGEKVKTKVLYEIEAREGEKVKKSAFLSSPIGLKMWK